ncbi:zinc finger protein RFP-like isoform X2 [Paroedura picta]|uniref:zinc finger protein RFP-like isoform X2 n=1 Tax=Paroedura picta TaxID=143630 RepID=UPI0040575E4C
MASESPRKRLREEVTCPICLDYFEAPVMLPCEHSFCRKCILQSLAKSPTRTLCPLCKRSFCRMDLQLNFRVFCLTRLIKLMNDQKEAGRGEVCANHQEPLKLFCKDSQVLICTSCKEEHQGHDIVPAEEAVKKCKDRISASLVELNNRKRDLMEVFTSTEERCDDLLEQMAKQRERMEAMFQNLWPFLEKQEDRTLARMKRVQTQMETKRDRHMDRLRQRLSSVEDLIQELEKRRELPASRLLQDVGSILKRSQQKVKLKNPSCFLPALKQKVSTFAATSANLGRAMQQFEESASTCY